MVAGAIQDDLVHMNGVDAVTGDFLVTAMPLGTLVRLASAVTLPPMPAPTTVVQGYRTLGLAYGYDAKKVESAGWGVIFPPDGDPSTREALRPLLDLRKSQTQHFREFELHDAEDATAFRRRHGSSPGRVDPKHIPYYLLLAGSPDKISFTFQQELATDHAVGRLDLEGLDAAAYAETVVRAESGQVTVPQRIALFAPRNPGDRATRMSAEMLAAPLAAALRATNPLWQVEEIGGAKAALSACMAPPNRPAILFTASHGLGYPDGNPRQQSHQGALICQEWRPLTGLPISDEQIFSADDVGDVCLEGMLAFHFACFSAGTPETDDFAGASATASASPRLAPVPFSARLPQRMLTQGALAVIGHVDRAWACSFAPYGLGSYIDVFSDCLRAIIDRVPVGHAVRGFPERWMASLPPLAGQLDTLRRGGHVDEVAFADSWTTVHDARDYVVLGDPAARLPCL